ncbi:MAG: RNA polymerase sigma factor [Candidatus Cyclobacteriaceae bacterium M3_2C_046]
MLKHLTYRELLIRIAKDDKKAFDELFMRLSSRLIKFAVLYVKSFQSAEDIVSDVFYYFLKNRHKATSIQDVEKYFYKAVKLQAYKHLKKDSKKELSIDEEYIADYFHYPESPESIYLNDELGKLIFTSIENLPPQRKAIFKMIKEDQLKYQEVAEIMNISVRTVENHLSLAIKDLKKIIFEYYQSTSDTKIIRLPLHVILLLISLFLII